MVNKKNVVKKKKFSAKAYTEHRKSMLKEEMRLIFLRDKINKELRDVRKGMAAWDRFLIQ